MKISRAEFERLNQLKEIDLQQCSFCHKITILNLGWQPFKQLYCLICEIEHVLCPELCLKVALNIFDCRLYRAEKPVVKEFVKPNKSHDWASCYLCSKELKGASKKSVIKNRNNPNFWGVESEFKIMCLKCIGKRYYSIMEKGKQKTFNKYVRRGYV